MVYDDKKDKDVLERTFICHLWREGRFLNLGEMSDGSKFTAVAQSVNEAKWLVDYEIECKLNSELYKYGFKNEDLFQFNKYKIFERINIKEELLKNDSLLKENLIRSNRLKSEKSMYDLVTKYPEILEKVMNELKIVANSERT